MNTALVVVIALIIVVPVVTAGSVMMWQSYKSGKKLEAQSNKERSVSTDVNIVDIEVGETPRLRDVVIENFRRKRSSMEDQTASSYELSSMASTSHSSQRRREKRRRRKDSSNNSVKRSHSQLTKIQSGKGVAPVCTEAATREPSHEIEIATV